MKRHRPSFGSSAMRFWTGAAIALTASLAAPNLHGLLGRKAGTAAGYEFSEAMAKSGFVWDETTLDDYTRDPKAKVPGTKMVYGGMKQPAQLADLVAYLKQATQ